MVFLSLCIPYHFTSWNPKLYNTYITNLEITNAVNIDSTIPKSKVCANPRIVPEPLYINTNAAIMVVTFPSIIADIALLKPTLIADCTVFPAASSSLILA